MRAAVPFSLVSQFSMAFGVNMELMEARQRSVSASVSTSASMYRIPPCSSSSLGSTALVTLGCCFALLLRFCLSVLVFLCRRDGSVLTVFDIFFACNSMMTVCLVLACLATIPFTLIFDLLGLPKICSQTIHLVLVEISKAAAFRTKFV